MDNETLGTVEIIFARLWEARFMSHLDLMRALSRSLRRGGLNIRFSEGFNPRLKISYCTQPLSVGHTSQCERLQFQMAHEEILQIGSEQILATVKDCAPPGVPALSATIIEPGGKRKNNGSFYEYLCFSRESSAPNYEVDSAEKPAAAEGSFQWKTVSMEEAAAELLVFSRDISALDFLKKNFLAAALITVGTGESWVRPDHAVVSIPGFAVPDRSIFFHRRAELF